jgi:hypothetical protein
MSDGIIKIKASGSLEFFTRFESTSFSNGTNLGTIENMSIETIDTKGTTDPKNYMLIPLTKSPPTALKSPPEVIWNVNNVHTLNDIDKKGHPIEDLYGSDISERITKLFKDIKPQGILLIPLEKGKPIKEHQNGTIIIPY